MADIVIVLGAGASVDCGAPVSDQLLNVAHDLVLSGRAGSDEAHFHAVETARRALGRVHTKADLDIDNVESVFSALDMAMTLQTLPDHKPEQIGEILSSMRRVIVRTLEESMRFEIDKGRPGPTGGGYIALANRLHDLKQSGRFSCAIITFNYDVALEVALQKKQFRYSYCLDNSAAPGALPLLKLHGSVNWFRKKDGSDVVGCDELHVAAQSQDDGTGSERSFRLRICAAREQLLSSMSRPQQELYEDVPFIVPPTWSKGEHYKAIQRIWQRAAVELQGASHLFILGYSLPPTDQFFRLLFALGTAGGPPFRNIVIANPDRSVAGRVKELLGMQARRHLIDIAEQASDPIQARFSTFANNVHRWFPR